MSRRLAVVFLAVATAAACQGPQAQPPLGEVLVVVDTDAGVPLLVSRLRVDAYTPSGTWYASQDFELFHAADWPASFGVYAPEPHTSKTVLLRLRAYASGNLRDYRGERYAPRPTGADPSADTPVPQPPPGERPRLVAPDGTDITPATEPQPLLAIDRLLRVTVTPDRVETLAVTLRGACFGTMADLANATTCTDTEGARSAVTSSATSTGANVQGKRLEGTFGEQPGCAAPARPAGTAMDGTPLYDEEVCVRGGAFILGNDTLAGNGIGSTAPQRVAVVPSFRLDRYEVTVARWRQALAAGFASKTALPYPNDGPFPTVPMPPDLYATGFCTFSRAPVGRETFPIACIDWDTARSFCQFEGGDLPTEAQWEYAAQMSARPAKTSFPWGGPDLADPGCGQAVFGRGFDGTLDPAMVGVCTPMGFGPLAVGADVYASGHAPAGVVGDGDVSVGLGVADLGGGVSEWVLDTAYSLGSNCWMSQPLEAPSCQDPAGANRAVRGGSWDLPPQDAFSGYRLFAPHDSYETNEGFRCARTGGP